MIRYVVDRCPALPRFTVLAACHSKQIAYEEKKQKVSMMNWGKLGKAAGQHGRGRGGSAGGGSETASEGLEAAWKDTTLPIAGDLLQCKHFKVCPGCEFDRRFDETPIMVDSRCGEVVSLTERDADAPEDVLCLGSVGAELFQTHITSAEWSWRVRKRRCGLSVRSIVHSTNALTSHDSEMHCTVRWNPTTRDGECRAGTRWSKH